MNSNEMWISGFQVPSLSQELLGSPVFLPVALSVFSPAHPGMVVEFLGLFETSCL